MGVCCSKSALDKTREAAFIECVQNLFVLIDVNKNGSLERGELLQYVQISNVKQAAVIAKSLMAECDTDNDGLVTMAEFTSYFTAKFQEDRGEAEEFLDYLQRLGEKPEWEKEALLLFNKIDAEHTGNIDQTDMSLLLTAAISRIDDDDAVHIDHDKAVEIYKSLHWTDDGEVSSDEFVLYLKNEIKKGDKAGHDLFEQYQALCATHPIKQKHQKRIKATYPKLIDTRQALSVQREETRRKLQKEFEDRKGRGEIFINKEFLKLFNEIDEDGNDVLTRDELSNALASPDSKLNQLLIRQGVPAQGLFNKLNSKQSQTVEEQKTIAFCEFSSFFADEAIDTNYWVLHWFEETIKLWQNPAYSKEEQGFKALPKNLDWDMRWKGHDALQLAMKKMLEIYAKDMRQNFEARVEDFDSWTKAVFTRDPPPNYKGKAIKLDRISGNSRQFWNNGQKDLENFAKGSVDRIANAMKYELSKQLKKATQHMFVGYAIRLNFEFRLDGNVGACWLDQGHFAESPRLLIRSGTMVDVKRPDSCLRGLLDYADVKHLTNLYAGHFPLHDVFEDEKQLVLETGGTYHWEQDTKRPRWRYIVAGNNIESFDTACDVLEDVIRDIVFPKQGEDKKHAAPIGSMLIHCAGGMHRTGMVFGIIRRLYSKDNAWPTIIEQYKRHVGWKSEQEPGGFEQNNIDFMQYFCENKTINNIKSGRTSAPDDENEWDRHGYVNDRRTTGRDSQRPSTEAMLPSSVLSKDL